MILLDTNVVSEIMKPRPSEKVMNWLQIHKSTNTYISATTKAELSYGLELMSLGQRRSQYQVSLTGILEIDFAGKILPFDEAAADAYAILACHRRKLGRPISPFDAQNAGGDPRYAEFARFSGLRNNHRQPLGSDIIRSSDERRQRLSRPVESLRLGL